VVRQVSITAIRRGNLAQESAAGICRRNLPQ